MTLDTYKHISPKKNTNRMNMTAAIFIAISVIYYIKIS